MGKMKYGCQKVVLNQGCTSGVKKIENLKIIKLKCKDLFKMKPSQNSLRGWLYENDYKDVLQIIDDIMNEWKKSGNKQRRNWWDILAGDKNGKSRIIAGRKIPVLKSAQIRKSVKITENAICKNEDECPPIQINKNNRWIKK